MSFTNYIPLIIYLLIALLIRRKPFGWWLTLMGLYLFTNEMIGFWPVFEVNVVSAMLVGFYALVGLVPWLVYRIACYWTHNTRLAVYAVFFTLVIGGPSLTDGGLFGVIADCPFIFPLVVLSLILMRDWKTKGLTPGWVRFVNWAWPMGMLLVCIWLTVEFNGVSGLLFGRGWFGALTLLPLAYYPLWRIGRLRPEISLSARFPALIHWWRVGSWRVVLVYLTALAFPGSSVYYLAGGMISAIVWDHYFAKQFRLSNLMIGVLFGVVYAGGILCGR